MLFLAKIFLTDARYEEAMNNQKSDSTISLLQSDEVMKFSVTDSNIQGKIHPALLFHLSQFLMLQELPCCIVLIVLQPLTVKVDSAFFCSLCMTVSVKQSPLNLLSSLLKD